MTESKQRTIDEGIIGPPKLKIKKTICIHCGERYKDTKKDMEKHYEVCEERQKDVENKQKTIDKGIVGPPKLKIKKTACKHCGKIYEDMKKHYEVCEERQKDVKKAEKNQKSIIDFFKQKIDLQPIETASIRPNSWNVNYMSQKKFEELKETIRIAEGEYVKYDPIKIREIEKGKHEAPKYETIDGEHRHRAFIELGYTHIPAIIQKEVDIEKAKVLNVIQNRNRGRINYFKFSKLLNEEYRDENGKKRCTQDDLAKKFGLKDDKEVSKIISIYKNLNIFSNKFALTRIYQKERLVNLAKCENAFLREKLIEQTIKKEWSSIEIRKKVKILNDNSKYLNKEFLQEVREGILDIFSGNFMFTHSHDEFVGKVWNLIVDNQRKDIIIKYVKDWVLHSNVAKRFKEDYIKEHKTYIDWYNTFRQTPEARAGSRMIWNFFCQYNNHNEIICWECKEIIKSFNQFSDHHEEYEFKDDFLFHVFVDGEQKIFPIHSDKKCHRKGNSKNWNKN